MNKQDITLELEKFSRIINSSEVKDFIKKTSGYKSIKSKVIKSILSKVSPEILNLSQKKLISIRSVSLKNNNIKESVNFCLLSVEKFKEKFEESEVYKKIFSVNHIFFIFDEHNNLRDIKLINFNQYKDYKEMCEYVYYKTREIFINGSEENFIRLSDKKIWHIRPKGINADDGYFISKDRFITKRAFWINREKLTEILL